MIRIINEDPVDVVEYMIEYLRKEEDAISENEYRANLNSTIKPNSRISKVDNNKNVFHSTNSIPEEWP